MEELLLVEELKTHFIYRDYVHKAVDGVSFSIRGGRSLGIVGESGSGKSITSLSIIRLLPRPGKMVSGRLLFEGRTLSDLSEKEMRTIRGRDIAMIFQDPLTALNPVLTVGAQIAENILMHEKISRKEAMERTALLMDMVRIPCGRSRLKDYPHQFSGGMRQRVMIAMALACNPRLLIADEPTTALDVTIQAQIMELIANLIRGGHVPGNNSRIERYRESLCQSSSSLHTGSPQLYSPFEGCGGGTAHSHTGPTAFSPHEAGGVCLPYSLQ